MTRIVPKDEGPEVRRVTWIGLFVNIMLTAIKFLAGIFGHSQALIADASYSDTEGPKYLVEACAIIAHALVEKMKNKE